MSGKGVFAKLNLLYRLIIHLIKKPLKWIRGYRGYDAFVSQYKGLEPVSEQTRAIYPSLSLCINCGICIVECSTIKHELPPLYLYVSSSRLLPELFYSEKLVKMCGECDKCLVHCPTGVQIKHLILLYGDMTGNR